MPIPLAVPIAVFFYYFFSALLPPAFAKAAYSGAVVGYICYDVGHFFLHHIATNVQYFKNLKSYHLAHHYVDPNLGFGVSSHFWDRVFGTLLPM
jgi:4-hydroxysphinganine ceramide fatty acyl 2-hydroxylase